MQYPFGYILSFPSKRHLFRGELELYEKSVPNLKRQINNMLPEDQDMHRILARLREAALNKNTINKLRCTILNIV